MTASPAPALIDPVRLVCQSCSFEENVENADAAAKIQAHETASPYEECTGGVYTFVPTDTIYAMTATSGGAMSETALCASHFADPKAKAAAEAAAAGASDFAGINWADSSGNDQLSCGAC